MRFRLPRLSSPTLAASLMALSPGWREGKRLGLGWRPWVHLQLPRRALAGPADRLPPITNKNVTAASRRQNRMASQAKTPQDVAEVRKERDRLLRRIAPGDIQTRRLVHNNCLKAAANAGLPAEAARIYSEAVGDIREENLNVKTFGKLMEACANADPPDPDAAKEWAARAGALGFDMELTITNILICCHARSGEIDEAEALFRSRLLLGDGAEPPDKFTFGSLIDAAARAGDVGRASLWFREMKKAGLRPDRTAYSALINAHAKHCKATRDPGRIRDAEGLLREMAKEGVRPDKVAFTAVIDACAQCGVADRAEWWLGRMKKAGILPSVFTYNAVMNAYAKRGKISRDPRKIARAEGILRMMEEDKQAPDLISFNALVDAYSQIGDTDGVRRWMAEMERARIAPDESTYNMLLHGYARQAVESARETRDYGPYLKGAERTFEEMQDRGQRPDVYSFNSLIRASAVCGEAGRATKWLESMKALGIEPDAYTYSGMFDAFANARRLGPAIQLYRDMGESAVEPNVEILTAALRVCANVRHVPLGENLDFAETVMSDVKMFSRSLKGFRPDVFVLHFCVRMHVLYPDDERPKSWIQWMVEAGVDPGKLKNPQARSKVNEIIALNNKS